MVAHHSSHHSSHHPSHDSSHRPSHSNSWFEYHRWHFDIDEYLNPYLPAPRWDRLPYCVSRWFGYRREPPQAMGNVLIALWTLVNIFCGVSIVTSVTMHVPAFKHHGAPDVIASFGAAAVLQFSAIESPFAQPRNTMVGQLIASVVGVSIAKLFALNPSAAALPEIAGPLACAVATSLMALTNTIHPPAGSTALLAVTQATRLGWWLIPVILLGSVLMQATAMLLNNIQRRYPVYWWTVHDLKKRTVEIDEEIGPEKGSESPSVSEDSLSDVPQRVIIRKGHVVVPDNLWISAEEREVLRTISERIL